MKELFLGIAAIIGCVIVFWFIIAGFRWFSQSTVMYEVRSPNEYTECLVVNTGEGIAVDCWEKK